MSFNDFEKTFLKVTEDMRKAHCNFHYYLHTRQHIYPLTHTLKKEEKNLLKNTVYGFAPVNSVPKWKEKQNWETG